MVADFFSRFGKIWGSNGGLETPTDDNANAGFEYLGDTKPSKQLFNWMFQVGGLQANWLYNQISTAASAAGIELASDDATTLKQLLDKKQNSGNYVPIAGGVTITGAILVPAITDWTKQQILGASSADSRYVQKAQGNQDFAPLQAGVNKTTGEIWLSYFDSNNAITYAFAQVAGNYATAPALTQEAATRAAADTNLNTAVNGKVSKGGDNIAYLNATTYMAAGTSITVNSGRSMGNGTGAINSGDYVWSPGLTVFGYGQMEATLQVTDVSGNGSDPKVGAHLYVKDYGGVQTDWYFGTNKRLRDPNGNYVDALPAGAIIMWSKDSGSIPTGWVLCDGTNGTPDLRDKCIVGAGIQPLGRVAGDWTNTANTNAMGDHNHFTNTLGHVLTWAEMPEHYHNYTWNGITTEGHGTHTMGSGGDPSAWNGVNSTSPAGSNAAHSHGIQTDGGHSHVVTVSTQQPSYYLFFIMKTGS